MSFYMTATHAQGKQETDAVFSVLKEAQNAAAAFGKEKIVNATIGAILDDNEQFAALNTVIDIIRQMPAEEMMNYAPISGLPGFLNAAIDATFRSQQPEGYVRAVATPGGSGGIRHVFYNYAEQGSKILIPDWAWGPYNTIAIEHLRGVERYSLFDEEDHFNLASLEEKVRSLLKQQDHLVVVFNTPAHNPTGYSLSVEEWSDVISLFRDVARDRNKRLVILADIAYIDFTRDPQKARAFMPLFSSLPDNILVTIAFSMSKSFLVYGMRSGALIGITASKDAAEEFSSVNAFSNRGTWSNGTRMAQRLLAVINGEPALAAVVDAERKTYQELVEQRAELFLHEAREVGLRTCPYRAGFFTTVPAADPQALAKGLKTENIFAVPLKKGVRFAVCSVQTRKIAGLATRTKRELERLGG